MLVEISAYHHEICTTKQKLIEMSMVILVDSQVHFDSQYKHMPINVCP